MNKSFGFIFFVFLCITCDLAFPQTNGVLGNGFFSNWSLSVSGGPNIFYGDIKEFKFFPATSPVNEIRYAGTFSINRQLSHVFMLRAQVFYGEIAGEKRYYKNGAPCNEYFEGNILEYNLNTTINFSNLFLKYNPKRFFFVYGTIGAGLSTWNSKLKDITTHDLVQGNGSSGTWNNALVIPAGLGAYFSIKDKVNLGVEWTLRGINSDKLDATIGGFPYDAYSLLAFNLTYNFNKRTTTKLDPASFQKQIGPPPPKPVLADAIEAEKKKEEAAKTAGNNGAAKSPVNDTTNPGVQVTATDTIPSELPVITHEPIQKEELADDTSLSEVIGKGVTYRVQVFAYQQNTYSSARVAGMFKLKQPVMKEFSGGWYRYTIGSFSNLNDARKLMNNLRMSKQVGDAFIAKYINGKRASPAPPRTVKHSKGKIYYHKPHHKK
jgi:hypothetical protein